MHDKDRGKNSGLKFIYFNANGLTGRVDEFRIEIGSMDRDIML